MSWPPALGSRATYLRGRLGGLEGRSLKREDVLRLHRAPVPASRTLPTAHATALDGEGRWTDHWAQELERAALAIG